MEIVGLSFLQCSIIPHLLIQVSFEVSGNYSVPIDDAGGGDAPSHIIQPLVQYIMKALPEYIKMSMSASQVLLGVIYSFDASRPAPCQL